MQIFVKNQRQWIGRPLKDADRRAFDSVRDALMTEWSESQAAALKQMEGAVTVFSGVARIDAVQHWLYTTDDPSREARRDKWVELAQRYGAGVSEETDRPREAYAGSPESHEVPTPWPLEG